MIAGSTGSPRPVIICGYPKSGTTLMLSLLDRHPELVVFPEETRFFQQIAGYPERQNPDYLLHQTSIKLFERDEFQMTSGFRDYSQINFELFGETLRTLWGRGAPDEASILEMIMQSYAEVTGQVEARYWVEKTPLNEKYLQKAHAWWPDLKAIYILRDPRDNFCSYQKQTRKRYESRRDRIIADQTLSPAVLKRKISKVSPPLTMDAFIAYWLESINAWEQFAHNNPNCLLIQYENLAQSPGEEMHRVAEFLGIKWDDILLEPTRNGSSWFGNSVFGAQYKGVSTSSLGRYKELLSEDDRRYLQSWLDSVMRLYGWQTGDNMIALGALWRGLAISPSTKPYLKIKIMIEYLRFWFTRLRNK